MTFLALQKAIEEKKWLLIYSLCGIVMMYLIFAPALNYLYYGGDDYRYSFGGPGLACWRDDGFFFMLKLGRPLQAYMDCLSFRYAYTVERMRDIRLISVLLMGMGVGFLADWLRCYGMTLLQCFLVATGLILIPHLYCDTLFMGAVSLPLPILLVVIAYRTVNRFHQNHSKKTLAWAIFLLLMALFSYPAMVFFYATLCLTKILFANRADWDKTRKEVITEIKIFSCACVIFFLYAFYNMHYEMRATAPPEYRLDHPNLNPIEIFHRLTTVFNVFDYIWSILPLTSLYIQGAIISLLACLGIVVLGIDNLKNKYSNFKIINYLLAMLVVILLCSAFVLIIPHFTSGLRLYVGPISAGIIISIWALFSAGRLFPRPYGAVLTTSVLIVYLLFQAYQANLLTMRSAAYAMGYLEASKEAIASQTAGTKELKRIHYIIPTNEYAYNRFFHTNAALAQLMDRHSFQLKWCAAKKIGPTVNKDDQKKVMECLNTLKEKTIGITYSIAGEPFTKTKEMVIVDKRFDDIKLDRKIFL